MSLTENLDVFIQGNVRRVLTHVDRDPDSPTYGCFDRHYWHYHARDYSSSILQQGLFVLEAIRKGDVPLPVCPDEAARLCQATVRGLTRQINARGGVDEYYPYEHSYVAGAFSLLAVARVLLDWQENDPALLEGVDWDALQRLTSHMVERREHRYPESSSFAPPACQFAAGLAALHVASRLERLQVPESALEEYLARLLEAQHEEGWFDEYGGPDFGYLSVTLDALADIHQITRAPEVQEALDRAIAFLCEVIGPDGVIPFELGCRNTEYFYPFGLVYAAQTNPLAAWLVGVLYAEVDQPTHFLWSVDDRYLCHCTMASVVRARPMLEAMCAPRPPTPPPESWLPGAGLWICRDPQKAWVACVAAKKGGLIRVARDGAPPIVSRGWRIRNAGDLWTNNWWSSDWKLDKIDNSLRISGSCHPVSYELPTTWKHAGLRLLSWLFRDLIKPILKKVLILRSGRSAGPHVERTVEIQNQTVRVLDRVVAQGPVEAKPAPRRNLRYVPSANDFLDEEWSALPIEEGAHRGESTLDIESCVTCGPPHTSDPS